MNDTRYLSKEFLAEFIGVYKNHPCLWQLKNVDYTNKKLKHDAYKVLINLCKTINPQANRDFVSRKIQSLRGSFRKELRKVEQSKRNSSSEDIYTPKLWYYDLLLFTKDQDVQSGNGTNNECGSGEDDDYDDCEIIDIKEEIIDRKINDDLCIESKNVNEPVDDKDYEIFESGIRKKVNTPSRLKQKRRAAQKNSTFMKACIDTLNSCKNEYSAFGVNVAAKLRKMDETQRIHAESLISQILYKGQLKQLTEYTQIK